MRLARSSPKCLQASYRTKCLGTYTRPHKLFNKLIRLPSVRSIVPIAVILKPSLPRPWKKTRRYGSATELAADLKRYLEDRPIAAKPASTTYQLRKFARRNKALVAGAAAVLLTLMAGIVVSTWQAVRARRAESAALEQRDLAEKNRVEAEKQAQLALSTIYQVVTETDEKLRPIAGTGALRKQLLESAMKNLDEISRTAATSGTADRTMGVALQRMSTFYEQMGATDKEVEALDRSLQIFERT